MKSFKTIMNRIPKFKREDSEEGKAEQSSADVSMPRKLSTQELTELSAKLSKRLKTIEAKNARLKEYAKAAKEQYDAARALLTEFTGLDAVNITNDDGSLAPDTIRAAMASQRSRSERLAAAKEESLQHDVRRLQQQLQQQQSKAATQKEAAWHASSDSSSESDAADGTAQGGAAYDAQLQEQQKAIEALRNELRAVRDENKDASVLREQLEGLRIQLQQAIQKSTEQSVEIDHWKAKAQSSLRQAETKAETQVQDVRKALEGEHARKMNEAKAQFHSSLCELQDEVRRLKADNARLEEEQEAAAAALKTAENRAKGAEDAAGQATQQQQAAIAAAVQRAADAARADADVRAKRARQLLGERDKEVAALRRKLAALAEEVAEGRPAERKLLRYAELQADRERELIQLRETCEALRSDLKDAMTQVSLAREQEAVLKQALKDADRGARRGTVNMEYLKNVVLNFMTFPHGSLQQVRLVPVIATLLQFSDEDVQSVVAATPGASTYTARQRRAPLHHRHGARPLPTTPQQRNRSNGSNASVLNRLSAWFGLSPRSRRSAAAAALPSNGMRLDHGNAPKSQGLTRGSAMHAASMAPTAQEQRSDTATAPAAAPAERKVATAEREAATASAEGEAVTAPAVPTPRSGAGFPAADAHSASAFPVFPVPAAANASPTID